jgi:ABC-2 type transport system permease protein
VILAAFFGATSVSRERWDNSINIVLTKPLFRRDYLIGKLMGITASLLVFIVFFILVTGIITATYFRGPLSMSESAWRIIVYIILLTLSCCLVAALNMFLGVLTKNVLFVVAASMTYVFAEWFWNISAYLPGYELISPMRVNGCMFGMGSEGIFLFDTLCPFTGWFSYAFPYIAITIIELVLVLLISIAMFSRSDNV